MKNKQELIDRIKSFENLQDDWDGYGSIKTTKLSIDNSISLLDKLDGNIFVFPMRDGGVQFEFDPDDKEIEILDEDITEKRFNENFDIIETKKYKYND